MIARSLPESDITILRPLSSIRPSSLKSAIVRITLSVEVPTMLAKSSRVMVIVKTDSDSFLYRFS